MAQGLEEVVLVEGDCLPCFDSGFQGEAFGLGVVERGEGGLGAVDLRDGGLLGALARHLGQIGGECARGKTVFFLQLGKEQRAPRGVVLPATGGGIRSRALDGAVDAATTDKGVLRDALMSDLRSINTSVGYISEEKKGPAIVERFRLPNGHNDMELVAKARAFLTAIAELGIEDELLALEHDENFLETLDARIEEFEGADDSQSGAEQQQVGATRSLPSVISRGLTILKGLNAIANNKYKSDAAKLGAWKTASHIERIGQKPKAKAPPAVASTPKSMPAPAFAGVKQTPALAGAR